MAREAVKPKREWPFLGWMSIVEMQQHIQELRAEIERLETKLALVKSKRVERK